MEDWVYRALAKWPNVPALYGWLRLDRRGRWRIKGEIISRPQIIDTINANYAADERGCWYFQNGPQRGYVALDDAPYVLRADGDALLTHTGLRITHPAGVYLDEEGALRMATEHGPGVLADDALPWALERLVSDRGKPDERALADALAQPDGRATSLRLHYAGVAHAVHRLDRDTAPATLGFVREPQP